MTGGEEYAVPVLKVREIITMMDITTVPQVPACVRGMINLRGKIIAGLKFGFPPVERTDQTCIIVVEVPTPSGNTMGVLVDGVSEALNIQAQEIEDTPRFGSAVCTDYMCGVAKVKGTVKILLDIDRVIAGSEMALAA